MMIYEMLKLCFRLNTPRSSSNQRETKPLKYSAYEKKISLIR